MRKLWWTKLHQERFFSSFPCLYHATNAQFVSYLYQKDKRAFALWVFLNMGFHGEALLASRRTPKLEYHPLSAVRDCLFNFIRSYPPYRRPFFRDERGMWRVWGRGEVCTGFWWGNLRQRDHWWDQDIDWRIILREIFRKWEGVVGTGWSWLRIGRGGGHLWVR